MNCPSCGAPVEEGADLCLECGEPMGDSLVAKIVRREASPPVVPSPSAPARAPESRRRRPVDGDDEPDALRCPGCGMPSRRDRCPNCGTVLRRPDD
jgi:predicted amidophosphoribosyltransferase